MFPISVQSFFFVCFPVLLGLSAFTGCGHTPDTELKMPPAAPSGERIQSTMFPRESASSAESTLPAAHADGTVPVPSKQFTLLLDNKKVEMADLEAAPPRGDQTVMIRVDPSTPYNEVVNVLEHLHDLGYLINFQPYTD